MGHPIEWVDADRFWAKVDKTGDCWKWTSRLDHGGYGVYRRRIDRREYAWRAHRVAYELVVGPIPAGLVIDHLCRVRDCVNPDHMEPVTHEENLHRGAGHPTATRLNPPAHCRNGHEFTPANTGSRIARGVPVRVCLQCRQERQRRSEADRRID